jgi:hypothetical protein
MLAEEQRGRDHNDWLRNWMYQQHNYVAFELIMKSNSVWDMKPRRGPALLVGYLHGLAFDPEDGGSTFL